MSSDDLGWGVLATGSIARSFVTDLLLTPGARLAAVGSRSQASADAFAEEFGGEFGGRAHPSYAALLADPDVDVVYVATPHTMHLDNTLAALAAGKHVLCEKPVTLNAADAARMFDAASDRFLMEAMWMACHPRIRAVREGLAAGRFGAPRHLHADIGFRTERASTDRLLDPALGGGALLDMGVYPLTLAQLLLGEPTSLVAAAEIVGGIDADIAIAGVYADGAVAAMSASMTSYVTAGAWLATDAGRLELHGGFFHPTGVTWHPEGSSDAGVEEVAPLEPVIGQGYGNEAAHVMACIRDGLRESPLRPHADTLAVMRQMDDLRRQIGLAYPGE